MKNNKFKAFMAIGVVAIGVLSASMYQTSQADSIKSEAKEIATCEALVTDVSNRIAHPLVKKNLNTSLGLKIANNQDLIRLDLAGTNPQKVSCNIKSIRQTFFDKINKIDNPQQINRMSTTPG
jgi:capsular polysaccharide biosynthesis protein